MLLVKVENGRNTLLMELPCKRMLMAEHLASIGISAPASEIKCIDEENVPIKVKILGVSEFAGKLASLISPEDSLSLVNTTCEMYQNLPYQNKLEAMAVVLHSQVDSMRDFLRYMMDHRMQDRPATVLGSNIGLTVSDYCDSIDYRNSLEGWTWKKNSLTVKRRLCKSFGIRVLSLRKKSA